MLWWRGTSCSLSSAYDDSWSVPHWSSFGHVTELSRMTPVRSVVHRTQAFCIFNSQYSYIVACTTSTDKESKLGCRFLYSLALCYMHVKIVFATSLLCGCEATWVVKASDVRYLSIEGATWVWLFTVILLRCDCEMFVILFVRLQL